MSGERRDILIAVAHPTVFTGFELDAFEREILANPKATERDAAEFFSRFPQFLLQGRAQELRREAVLLGSDNKAIGRVDFFRRSFGADYWDLIELKHPQTRIVVGANGSHPRLSAHVYAALNQAEDYREWLRTDTAMRENLLQKGIMVNNPRVWVVAGRDDAKVNQDISQRLRSRIEQSGVEFSSYTDVFRFAKEHYQSTKVVVCIGALLEVDWTAAVFHKDREHRFIYANKALTDLLGMSLEQVVGKTDQDLFASSDEVRHFREQDERVLADGKPKEQEELFVEPSGRQVLLRTTKFPLLNKKGEIVGVSGKIERLS